MAIPVNPLKNIIRVYSEAPHVGQIMRKWFFNEQRDSSTRQSNGRVKMPGCFIANDCKVRLDTVHGGDGCYFAGIVVQALHAIAALGNNKNPLNLVYIGQID